MLPAIIGSLNHNGINNFVSAKLTYIHPRLRDFGMPCPDSDSVSSRLTANLLSGTDFSLCHPRIPNRNLVLYPE